MISSWKRGFFLRENWRAPRSIVCGMFWMAIVILFIGMILMVISKHKGGAYVIWGGILLGFGFCIVLVCFLLCLNAYKILAQKNKLPQTPSQHKYNLTMPSSTIIHSIPANQPLNYPHIFMPIQPPKFETSQDKNLPVGKRSEYEKSISFDLSTFPHQATPGQKKKVRLQNGDTFDDKCHLDDRVIPDGRGIGSTPTFSVPREVNVHKPHPLSVHDMSKLRNNFRAEESNNQSKFSMNHRKAMHGKPEYLTDDEVLIKSHDKENYARKSHSRTLSNSYQRNAGDETLVENVGSTRVKVRPIKSRLYSPEWVADNSQPSKEGDMVNVIHF